MIRLAGILLLAIAASGADLRVEKTDAIGRKVENDFFVADLSSRTAGGRPEDSGTLRALTLKAFGVTLFRDPVNGRMHKGLSIQRVGARSYKDIGEWSPVQSFREERKDGVYVHRREGYFADYPEVKLAVEYRFLPDVPYFLVAESMTVEKPLRVVLLRSNEMTMNLFFTHVAWPDRDGKLRMTTFDARGPILAREPIPADVPWLAFVNPEKGYGYGFVTVEHEASKSVNADITISDGFESPSQAAGAPPAVNGRYWSRHLVIGKETDLVPGDRFRDVTAYVIFRSSKEKPVSDLLSWANRIRQSASR
jgi:hypothetical protein